MQSGDTSHSIGVFCNVINKFVHYNYPGQLSLANPPRVGKMSTGDYYGHRQERNGEFCVTVGPVTRTADILTQSVKATGC